MCVLQGHIFQLLGDTPAHFLTQIFYSYRNEQCCRNGEGFWVSRPSQAGIRLCGKREGLRGRRKLSKYKTYFTSSYKKVISWLPLRNWKSIRWYFIIWFYRNIYKNFCVALRWISIRSRKTIGCSTDVTLPVKSHVDTSKLVGRWRRRGTVKIPLKQSIHINKTREQILKIINKTRFSTWISQLYLLYSHTET